MYKSWTVFVAGLLLWGALSAQSGFRAVYDIPGSLEASFEKILVLNDSSVLLAGERLGPQFAYEAFAMRVDLAGNILWARGYPLAANPSLSTFGSAFVEGYLAPDGNAVLAVDLQPAQGVVKIAPDGNVLWYNTLPVLMVLRGWITPEPDGSGTLLGTGTIGSVPLSDVGYLATFDSDGQLTAPPSVLQSSLSTFRFFRAITDAAGNRYIIGYLNQLSTNIIILKFPPGSTVPEWIRRYSIAPSSSAYYGAETFADGRIIWGGNDDIDKGVLWAMRPDGSTEWRYNYTAPGEDLYIRSLAKTDGGLVAVLGNAIIAEFDFDGAVRWAYDYAEPGREMFLRSVALAPDGGLLFAGSEQVPTTGQSRPILLKTNAEGLIEGCCARPVPILRTARTLPQLADLTAAQPNIPLNALNGDSPAPTLGGITLNRLCPNAPFLFPADSALCSPGCVDLVRPAIPPGGTGQWVLPVGVTETVGPSGGVSRLCFDSVGVFAIEFTISVPGGCLIAPYRRTVRVLPLAEGDIDLALSDTLLCPGRCVDIRLNPSGAGAVLLDLQTPGGTPQVGQPDSYCYALPGTYAVTAVYEQDACRFVTNAEVRVADLPDVVPNAFTPDGDGTNDVFRPRIDCLQGPYRLRIFNRWGQLVFETEDYLNGWDGTSNGAPAPSDVYIWVLDAQTDPLLRKGDVTLLR